MADYRKVVREGSAKVSEGDVRRAVEEFPAKLEAARSRVSPEFIENAKALWEMLRDWLRGEYREVPWATIAAAAFALLYFINPFDIVPDFLIPAGLVDDATVLGLVIAAVGHDLRKYRNWRETRKS